MEYICKIFLSTENVITVICSAFGLKLPLFELEQEPASTGTLGYMLYFYKEDRYTPNLINVFPPKKLTEEQFKIINEKWNYCVENDLFELEFEL